MNKKVFALGLLSLAMSGQVALAAFTDIEPGSTYADAAAYGAQNGYIYGYADGSFKPENKINRAEFIKIVVEANTTRRGIDSCVKSNPDLKYFSDTPSSEWYGKYICVAKKNGIISGYPDGTFKPSDNINFAEAAKIISIAKNGQDAGSSLSAGQSDWYQRYVSYLDTSKAIPATVQSITYKITRGEMIEMIYRLDKSITDKFSLTYDEVAGAKISCMKAGQTAGGIVYPGAPRTDCCTGLTAYAKSFDKGGRLLGAYNALCMEPVAGLDQAVKIMDASNECTDSVDLGQTLDPAPYRNMNFNGFSFPMNSYKAGCAARCDVNLDNSTASIGWMCTGALVN